MAFEPLKHKSMHRVTKRTMGDAVLGRRSGDRWRHGHRVWFRDEGSTVGVRGGRRGNGARGRGAATGG